jgi:AcrR family transcriptional regulator
MGARGTARNRLVATTAEMIYRRGVTACGVDRITEMSGVSKPTLYTHFRTKSDLVAAALTWRHETRREEVYAYLDEVSARGIERILALFDWAARVSEASGHRGCAFLNAAAELVDPAEDAARRVVRAHKAWWRDVFADLVRDCEIDAPEQIAEELLLVLDGAFAESLVLGNSSPMMIARRVAAALLRDRLSGRS